LYKYFFLKKKAGLNHQNALYGTHLLACAPGRPDKEARVGVKQLITALEECAKQASVAQPMLLIAKGMPSCQCPATNDFITVPGDFGGQISPLGIPTKIFRREICPL
jgi:hypothetical protein